MTQAASRVPIRAVTFDAAGTLIAPREPVGQTYARIARQHGIYIEPEVLEARFRASYRNAPPLCFPHTPEGELSRAEQRWWRSIVRTVFAEVPRAVADKVFLDLFLLYGKGEAWEVFPEVRATLAELGRRGVRRAIVSNFDARLFGICTDLGLSEYFDAIVPSSRAGAAKPSPRIFWHALALLSVPAERALHVGDSWEEDVLGAAAAGMCGLWIDRTQPSEGQRIHSLAEVLDWVSTC